MRARYLGVAALAVAILVAAHVRAAASDAALLLALHRQYVGWQYGDGTFTSMRETGNIVSTATPAPGATPSPSWPIVRLVRGPVFRETETSPRTHREYDSGFTGRIFWESNENGFTHPVTGNAQRLMISEQFLFDEATSQLAGTAEPAIQIDGHTYPVVRVAPAAGFPIDLAIDPQTGAYVKATIDPGGSDEESVRIFAYAQPMPGKRVMSRYAFNDSADDVEWTSFDANATIGDEELHPPPETATWTFANPAPFSIVAEPGYILVPVVVNGVSGTFLLDSGAAGIVLLPDFAARAHVRHVAKSAILGIGGTRSAETDVIDTLEVGGNTLSNVTADASAISSDYRGIVVDIHHDHDVDGILGYDFLAGAIVKVNQGAKTMTILNPATADLTSVRGAVVDVDLSAQHAVIPVTLNGTVDLNATLDTGAGIILYNHSLIDKYHLVLMHAPAIIGGVGGQELTDCSTFDRLSIGPITYAGEIACQTDILGADDVLLGMDFLHHFNITFDYPDSQIVLEPLP